MIGSKTAAAWLVSFFLFGALVLAIVVAAQLAKE